MASVLWCQFQYDFQLICPWCHCFFLFCDFFGRFILGIVLVNDFMGGAPLYDIQGSELPPSHQMGEASGSSDFPEPSPPDDIRPEKEMGLDFQTNGIRDTQF